MRRRERILTPSRLAALGGNGAEPHVSMRSALRSANASPPKPRVLGGASEKMADEHPASNTYIESEITRRLRDLEALLDSDVITCIVPIHQPVDDLIRGAVEDIAQMRRSGKL